MTIYLRHRYIAEPDDFEWPDATNTGVPAGTSLTTYSGPSVISTNNTTVTAKTIGNISVTANNVSFINCLFSGSGSWGIEGDAATNMIVTDCTFSGSYDGAILAQGTFTRLNIYNCRIGLTLKDGTSTASRLYIHGLDSDLGDPHYDGIFISGGQTNCLVEDCWIDVPADHGTSDVFIANRWADSPIVNTTVNHCRLLGGPSYAMYAEHVVMSPPSALTGTVWSNNEVQRGGSGGYWSITNCTVTRSGNVDYLTGVNIDSEG